MAKLSKDTILRATQIEIADITSRVSQITSATSSAEGDQLKNNDFFSREGIIPLTKKGKIFEGGKLVDTVTSPRANPSAIDELITNIQNVPANYGEVEEANKSNYPEEVGALTVSAGKRLVSIDRNFYGPNEQVYLDNSDPREGKNFVGDPLRGRTGAYWTKDSENRNFTFLNKHNIQDNIPVRINYRPVYDDEPRYNHGLQKSDFGRTWQWLLMKPSKMHFKTPKGNYSKKLWSSYVQGGTYSGKKLGSTVVPANRAGTSTGVSDKITSTRPGTPPADRGDFRPSSLEALQNSVANVPTRTEIFFDHSFEMVAPFTEKEVEKLNPVFGSKVADIKAVYNFYIDEYETTISSSLVSEKTLPNVYVMISENEAESPPPIFKKHITLNNNLKTDQKAFSRVDEQKYDLKDSPIGEYFDLYGTQYGEIIQKDSLEDLKTTFTNLMFSVNDLAMLREQTEKKEMFPMFFDIRFSTDKNAFFAEILKEAKLMDYMTNFVMKMTKDKQFDTKEYQTGREVVVQRGEEVQREMKFTTSRRRMWDMNQWLSQPLANIQISDGTFLGEMDNSIMAENGEQYKLFNSLMRIVMTDKTNKLIKTNFRTYEDILSGKLAYNETILYRVAKFEGRTTSGDPIQNFYFPNSLEEDMVRYVDTQVKYDKEYTYVVYAYQIVVGNKYWYDQTNATNNEEIARCKLFQEPSVTLVEVPYYNFAGRIVDRPPVIPDVTMTPYKSIDNKVLISFNTGIGDYKDDPIVIEPEDRTEISKIRMLQKVGPDDPIEFGSDDGDSTYEVYRLDKKPESYSDFSKNLRAVVSTDVDPLTAQKATSAAFVDVVKPNKKHYYTFRSIDIHGNKSNPTALYEVEMVNDAGTIYPEFNVVDFDKPETIGSRTAKKYIQIIPTIFQGLINEKASGFDKVESANDLPTGVQLGIAEESVWNKKFKLVMTSRSSGKKMHINFDFKHKHVTT